MVLCMPRLSDTPPPVDPTTARWQKARELFSQDVSWAGISEQVGFAINTLRARCAVEGWQRSDGLTMNAPLPEVRASTERAILSNKKRVAQVREQLAERLLADTTKLLDQLFEPRIYKEAKVVSGGAREPGFTEIVEIEVDRPSHTDQLAIAKAASDLIAKSQLLAGEATTRQGTEERTPQERKDRISQIRDELQERRANRGGGDDNAPGVETETG